MRDDSATRRDDPDADALATRLDDARCARYTSERTRCRTVPEGERGDARRVCERERVVRRACPGRPEEELERTTETFRDDGGPDRAFGASSTWSSSSSWTTSSAAFGDAWPFRGMDDDAAAASAAKFFERAASAFASNGTDASVANREGGDAAGGFLADAFVSAARAFAEELTRASLSSSSSSSAGGGGRVGDGDEPPTPRLAK